VLFQDFPGPGIFKKKIQDFPGGVGNLIQGLFEDLHLTFPDPFWRCFTKLFLW